MSVHRSLFTLPPSAPHHNDSADFPASHLAALQLQPITRPKSLSRTILAQDKHKGGVHAITGRALKAQGVQEAARRFGLRVLEGADYIPGIGKIDSSVDEEGESSDEDAAPLDPHRSDDVDDGHNPILWPRVHSDGEPEEEIDDAATTTTATTLSKASSSAITPLQQSLLSSPPLKTGTLLLLGGGNFAAAVIALNPFVELSLLGSSEQAASFISQYVAQRFPNAPRSQPQPQPSGAGAGASSSPSSQPRQQQAKQHGKQKLTTPKQRLLQPATAKRVVKETPEAFGPVGTVYHKDKDFVLDGYRRPAVITAPHGPASVPTPPPTSENEAASTSYQQPTLIAAAEQQPTADVTAPELETIAPTAAMRELDALLAELVVSEDNQGSAPPELVLCFCQGRVHPLHPQQPLCPTCALPLCTSLLPSPLHPLSRCPSCARSPILPPTSPLRTHLIASLQSQRLALEIEERQRIERVRRERRARDENWKERSAAAENAFPALDGHSGSSGTSSPFMTSSHSHPPTGTYGMAGYGPRSNAVAIALGRRAPTENERAALQQRTHRVLRIPTKGAPPAKRASKKSKKVKAEGAKNASKESAARNNTATPTAAVVTPDEADESDDDDDADADLGSSAVEVTITILVPDTDDDGWPALAHQAPSSLSSAADVDDAQQAAIQRQRAMARTVGGHRLLANPRLEAGSRPTYTARKEREARRAAWLAAGEDGGDHDE